MNAFSPHGYTRGYGSIRNLGLQAVGALVRAAKSALTLSGETFHSRKVFEFAKLLLRFQPEGPHGVNSGQLSPVWYEHGRKRTRRGEAPH